MAERIRIGVAGLGRIGWHFHCRALARHLDFTLAAVQDPEPERRREAEATYGAAGYANFGAMLRDADLQAVVIATPTHLHRPMAEEALGSGCHVLLEKPMAQTLAAAEAILDAATRHQRVLTIYQPHRAEASFQHLCHLLATGKIGQVYHVRRGMFSFARRNDWQSLRRYGGGMLNNYGAHALDQVLQLVGYDVQRVFCNLRLVASLGDAEDVVKVLLETRQGVLGEVDINQATAIQPYELQVWGTRGAITLQGGTLTLRYFRPEDLPPKALDPHLASANREYPSDPVPWQEERIPVDPRLAVDVHANFAAAIREGAPLLVAPHETVAVMRVIEQCRADAGAILHTGLA